MTQLSAIAKEIAQDVGASPDDVEAELHRYHNEFRVSLEQSKIQVRKDFGGSPDRDTPPTPSESPCQEVSTSDPADPPQERKSDTEPSESSTRANVYLAEESDAEGGEDTTSEPDDPFVSHYDETLSEVRYAIDALNLSDRCDEKAMEVADLMLKEVSEETQPAPVASGIVYTAGLLTNDKRTQAEVAEALCTSEQSVKNHYPKAIRVSNFGK